MQIPSPWSKRGGVDKLSDEDAARSLPPQPFSSTWPLTPVFINKSFRRMLAQASKYTFGFSRQRDPTVEPMEVDMRVGFHFPWDKLAFTKFSLPSPNMDISAAIGSVVAHSSFVGGWGVIGALTRASTWCHIKRVIYDVTIANTQLVIGPDTTLANCHPMTLPGIAGLAQEMDIWVPPGWIIGLTTTGNAGDNTRDLTILGEVVPFIAPFDYSASMVFPDGYEWPSK